MDKSPPKHKSYMKHLSAITFITALSISLLNHGALRAQEYLVSSEFLSNTPAFLLSVPPFVTGQYGCDYYRITYNTTDIDGSPTIASGAVAVPVANDNCDVFPMAIYCHGTVLRKLDVPSEENSESQIPKVFAGQGYIAVAPDYLGLGINPGLHPYVHAESEATASIDAFFAAREFIESLDMVHYSGETGVTGYSQGGHAAMATLKYAQENDLLEEMGIVAGAPLSGPYNLSGSQADVLLTDEPYSNPGYVVYLLKAYERVYGTLYDELSDILLSPYDEDVLPYFDGMQNEYDMGVVNELLPDVISEYMQDTVLMNLAIDDQHPIWASLRDNDNYDWAPQMPIRMFYCDGDEQVPFENSIVARDSMLAKGAEDVDAVNVFPGATHGLCVIPAIVETRLFFQSVISPCSLISSTDDSEAYLPLELWPNPSSGRIRMRLSEPRGLLSVYDLYGKVVHQEVVNQSEFEIDLSQLPGGVYLAIFEGMQSAARSKVVIH